MIELRKKRNLFHEAIRMQKRQAFKAQARKKLISSQKRQQVIEELVKAFWSRNVSQAEKHEFWVKEFIPNIRDYESVYKLIDSVCQGIKMIICEYEKDEENRTEIIQYLFDNLPFLIPPSHFDLQQLPIFFIQLCIHILREVSFTSEEKEQFVDKLNYETINKCLLNYFVLNWVEISQNKCNDIMMTFFTEMTQFKNIFKRYVYYDIKFEYLLNNVIDEILDLTKVQRSIYELFDLENQKFIDDFISNTSTYNLLQSQNFRIKYEQNGNNQIIVLNKSMFLCNLLLLSPIPNYNMKQIKQKLKAILNYLYRKLFLKQNPQLSKQEIEFCISVLISKTIDINPYNHLQIIQAVIKSGNNRQIQKKSVLQEEFQQNQMNVLDKQKSIKRNILYQETLNMSNENFQNFLNKVKLMMLYETSQELQHLKFDHIEKWLTQQIRNEKNNILSLQNPNLMSQLLRLLANIIKNHSSHKYNSYDSYRNRMSNRSQDCLLIKIKICKLIGKKGFDQLFQHENLKFYCSELIQFLVTLVQGLEQCGDISSSIEVLFFNSQILFQDSFRHNFRQNDIESYEEMENQSIFFMNSFKYHIYSVCLKFLQRSYKYLSYEKKEKILLNLILVDYLTFEDCRKYLTREQEQKLRKNSFTQEDYFEKEQSTEQQCYQSEEEFDKNQKDFDDDLQECQTRNTNEYGNQNNYFKHYQTSNLTYENYNNSNQNQYGNIFSQPYQQFKPRGAYEEGQIEI